MKDIFIAILLGIIMVLKFFDVITDISLGVPTWHIIEESLIVFASAVGFVFLIIEIKRRTQHIEKLKLELARTDTELEHISSQMRAARSQYSELIYQQFHAWQLSQSEQQVAMLLLKGLSFREISAVRDTKEKTVRQQASNIYSKAQVDGRHAFAAWFFEDFLTPEK